MRFAQGRRCSIDELVLQQLLAQRVAVQAQPLRGARLVVLRLLHHDFKQGLFDRLDQHVVQAGRVGAVEIAEIVFQAGTNTVVQVVVAHAASFQFSSWGVVSSVPAAAQASKLSRTQASWACALARVLMCPRNSAAAPLGKGSACAYQPRCLRALRTPVNSPYRL